jgi:hypothetical protein
MIHATNCSAGGGSGGSVLLKTKTLIAGSGTIRSDGGNGGRNTRSISGSGAGGAGGRIAVYVDHRNESGIGNAFGLNLEAFGGLHGKSSESNHIRSAPGTVFWQCKETGTSYVVVDNGPNDMTTTGDAIIVNDVDNLHFDHMRLVRRGGLRWRPTIPAVSRGILSVRYLEGDTTGQWTIEDNSIGLLNAVVNVSGTGASVNESSEHPDRIHTCTRLFEKSPGIWTSINVGVYHFDDVNLGLTKAAVFVKRRGELVTPAHATISRISVWLFGRWRGLENLSVNGGGNLYVSPESNAFLLNSLSLFETGNCTLSQNLALSVSGSLELYNASQLWVEMNASITVQTLYIDSLATILGQGLGFGSCSGPGRPGVSRWGASHGGLGGNKDFDTLSVDETIGSAYGDVFFPIDPGSGSCHIDGRMGAGGGSSVQLNVAEWSHVEGTIDMSGGDARSETRNT